MLTKISLAYLAKSPDRLRYCHRLVSVFCPFLVDQTLIKISPLDKNNFKDASLSQASSSDENCTCLVIVSVSVKNVMEMSKLNAQLVEVAKELPKLRAHKG